MAAADVRDALVSITEGKDFARISAISFPAMAAYAARIGADFIPLTEVAVPGRRPQWGKLTLRELCPPYDRVAFLDADIVVRPSAPSIFDQVPAGTLGALDERALGMDRAAEWAIAARIYGRPELEAETRYFNAGVMVFDRESAAVLRAPIPDEESPAMPEQTHLNAVARILGVPVHDIGPAWNGFYGMFPPGRREGVHVLHYACHPKWDEHAEALAALMKADLALWS